MDGKALMARAVEAMSKAYAPYSGFCVGAALLCEDGTVYEGCNVENASYGATNCAERTAFFKAISEGKRKFTAIALCGGKGGKLTDFTAPCGICRQVMREFCGKDFVIYLTNGEQLQQYTLEQLLPQSFGPEHL